jgi:hydroxymethylbilane synthase
VSGEVQRADLRARTGLRLGARGSALSRAQAELVRAALGGDGVEVVYVTTTGDRRSAAGQPIEWKGDFTRELDQALRDGRIDFAVHSLKDVPAVPSEDLVLTAVPPREDPSDVLVSNGGLRLAALPPGARVGTSSPRRRAQLLRARPDLRVEEIRGNVDTRVRRLREGRCDALVLARAGLARLGRLDEIVEVCPRRPCCPRRGRARSRSSPAPPTGARATRSRRSTMPPPTARSWRRGAFSPSSRRAARLRSRRAPARRASAVRLTAAVFSPDGSRALRESAAADGGHPADLGERVARRLLDAGAAELIREAEAP